MATVAMGPLADYSPRMGTLPFVSEAGNSRINLGRVARLNRLQVAKIAHKRSNSAFEPLLDLQEAASVLGMHWKTLEGKARNKEIAPFKVGKRWRLRLSSLNVQEKALIPFRYNRPSILYWTSLRGWRIVFP